MRVAYVRCKGKRRVIAMVPGWSGLTSPPGLRAFRAHLRIEPIGSSVVVPPRAPHGHQSAFTRVESNGNAWKRCAHLACKSGESGETGGESWLPQIRFTRGRPLVRSQVRPSTKPLEMGLFVGPGPAAGPLRGGLGTVLEPSAGVGTLPAPMANPNGHPASLARPDQPNYAHGVYSSRRELPAEAEALVDDLMALGHVVPADRLAAEEVARLVYLIGRVDAALEGRVFTNPGSKAMALLGERRLLSASLERWLGHFGLTPRSRAGVGALSGGADARGADPGGGGGGRQWIVSGGGGSASVKTRRSRRPAPGAPRSPPQGLRRRPLPLRARTAAGSPARTREAPSAPAPRSSPTCSAPASASPTWRRRCGRRSSVGRARSRRAEGADPARSDSRAAGALDVLERLAPRLERLVGASAFGPIEPPRRGGSAR
jgi:hypothetical protein